MEQPASTSLFDLHIDHQSSSYLHEASRWAKFLAIVGFIFCGLLALIALFAGSFLGKFMDSFGSASSAYFGGAFVTIIYFGLALLYFFPCLYLYRFGSRAQTALRANDNEQMTSSFRSLKSCFRFLGILTIIVLSFYVLVIIIGIIVAGFASTQLK
jgi:hypothetical protein